MKRLGLITITVFGITIGLLTYLTGRKAKSVSVHVLKPGSSVTATIVPTVSAPSLIPASTPLTASEQQEEAAKIVRETFNAPISFFGKVQDQNGAPISEASVEFGAIDRFWEPGSKYQTVSDANGLFSITGIKGAGLTVGVSKEGYDGIQGLSYQSFGYGMPPDSNRKTPPPKNEPATFVLRKKARAEPMVSIHRDILVPKDGTSVEISLKTGRIVERGEGDIMIECRADDLNKDAQGHYEWKFRLSVPGGGLIVRGVSESGFEAPESGYAPAIEAGMSPASLPWHPDSDEQYWLRLHNGTYARMRFRITTGGTQFVTIMAYLNPSGSRNLEYDPNNVVR